MPLFSSGDFLLSSGRHSEFKIDCDNLLESDIKTLAWMISEMVGPFSEVQGVPSGGMILANFMTTYAIPSQVDHPDPRMWGRRLIVDDVLTTGGSMERARQAHLESQPEAVRAKHMVIGAVIFSRGQCPPWIQPLFQLHGKLFGK